MLRQSKYNFVVRRGQFLFLYNCRTEKVTVLQPELLLLLRNGDFESLGARHPSFYDYLVKEGYLVDSGTDEVREVINGWTGEDHDPRSFSMFVNPTLDCNMKCWYCYEEHRPDTRMGQGVQEAILGLLSQKMGDDRLSAVNVGFFGGEPLLEFDGVVIPLLEKVEGMCAQHGKSLSISFVTNGSLLTTERIARLKRLKVSSPVHFQIALDGDRHHHNLIKRCAEVGDTYAMTLRAIRQAISAHMTVTVRLNATSKNMDSYMGVLDDFSGLSDEERGRLRFDIQHIWQDPIPNASIWSRCKQELHDSIVGRGFGASALVSRGRCYADRENHVVINYNGDVFKCTARDFSQENREGVLTPDGHIVWNGRHDERRKVVYGSAMCQACRIFPLCHGACSQEKLEHASGSGCPFGLTERMKIEKVESRMDFLLESLT